MILSWFSAGRGKCVMKYAVNENGKYLNQVLSERSSLDNSGLAKGNQSVWLSNNSLRSVRHGMIYHNEMVINHPGLTHLRQGEYRVDKLLSWTAQNHRDQS